MAEQGRNILIIDDDKDFADLLGLILRRDRNDTIRCAYNGYTGLAMAEEEPPDLVILDIIMMGLSGYQVYQRLRMIPALKQVPVLFCDEAWIPDIDQTVEEYGAAGFLPKIFQIEELLRARDMALRGEVYHR